jgi:membrane protein
MMKPRPKGIFGVIRETFKSWSEDKAPRLAAALSYYTIFSIAPLLVLVIAITGFVNGNNTTIRDQILAQVQSLMGAQGAQMVNTLITNASRPREGIIASVIGVITLIFGATGVFNQLKDALNTIWEVAPKKGGGIMGMVTERVSGLVMILGLGFLLLVSLVLSTALSVLNQYFTNLLGAGSGTASLLVNYGIQIVVITLIFSAIFREVPDVEIRWSDVWVGGLVTAILFLAGQYLISLYLSKASPASTYGAAGSLVVVLLWLYYSAQILFLGAEFTKVYSHWRRSNIVPSENARPLTPTERIQQGIARPQDEARVSRGTAPAAVPVPVPVSGEGKDQDQVQAQAEERKQEQKVSDEEEEANDQNA